MGFADDLLSTSPYFKFLVQIINATILIFFGIYVNIFDSQILNYLITYFWVIGIMNSINMLDNMDAISSMVTISILLGALANIYLGDLGLNDFSSYLTVGLVGALLSFLIFFNWNPSKMYMGDNGSQLIGSVLAIIGILFFWNTSETHSFISLKPVLATALAFLIPLVDTTTVTINRLLKKKSPFVGGKDHTTHHLSYAGLSDRKLVILLTSISVIAIACSVYIINFVSDLSIVQAILFTSFAVIVFIILYSITKITKPG